MSVNSMDSPVPLYGFSVSPFIALFYIGLALVVGCQSLGSFISILEERVVRGPLFLFSISLT